MTRFAEASSTGHGSHHGDAMDAPASPFEAYDEKIAATELRRYRKNGPNAWTRALVDALVAEGMQGTTLLDIGGGIGAIQHELLTAGSVSATSVDASSAYLGAAREESNRRGLSGRVTYHHGDFVELAARVPPADIVTLDRVLNVYPDWERLAALSAERARRLYGIVIPRDTRFVRLVIRLINFRLRRQRKRLRAAVIPIGGVDRVLQMKGFSRQVTARVGPAWQVAIYRRM
jgi:2-polyprenyl-3-methyl-5-hydroxy-6-metoxy-1,4-benzoquinol methylase